MKSILKSILSRKPNRRRSWTTFSLFSGFGGETLGKQLALKELGLAEQCTFWAINHWQVAIETLKRNFPHALTFCEDITQVDALGIGIDRIDLLWASPSCTHHSNARGGKPRDDQQRAHATEVYERWIRQCDVPVFVLENVREFLSWGPLDPFGRPIRERKGEYFRDFVAKLKKSGYTVEWRILCAADYGDPTTRKRLFLIAVKDGQGIPWPKPTHRDPSVPLEKLPPPQRTLPVWKSAADHVIDWSIPGRSIYYRTTARGNPAPLASDTIRRIRHGLIKYGLKGYFEDQSQRSPSMALIDPESFLMCYHGGPGAANRICSADDVLPTLDCSNRFGLVRPMISKSFGPRCTCPSSGLQRPLPSLTTVDHNHLCQPFILRSDNTGGTIQGRLLDRPVSTIVSKACHHFIQPYFIEYYGASYSQPTWNPLPTVTTKDRHGLVDLVVRHEGAVQNLPVVRTAADIEAHDFSRPFCVEIAGDRLLVDITLRMLEPRELARAMGFPESFRLDRIVQGQTLPLSKKDATKMIGNACPVNTVKEIIKAVLKPRLS